VRKGRPPEGGRREKTTKNGNIVSNLSELTENSTKKERKERHSMKKKLLALVLVAIMILGFMPQTAKADDPNSVTVYFSLSNDDVYMEDCNGDPMAFREITVPYFDLDDYGLSYYYFSSEHYGNADPNNPWSHVSNLAQGTYSSANGKVTLLHLLIYAMERYGLGYSEQNCGTAYDTSYITTTSMPSGNLEGDDSMIISGTPGSLYFDNYWDIYDDPDPFYPDPGETWNYFVNYQYPLASAGWGATADQILLHDGDVITMAHFNSLLAILDADGVFAYARPNGEVYDYTDLDTLTIEKEVTSGNSVTFDFYHAAVDSMTYETSEEDPPTEVPVYICSRSSLSSGDITDWTSVGTTTNGSITVNTSTLNLNPGTYIVATPGWESTTIYDIACAPGGILLKVIASN